MPRAASPVQAAVPADSQGSSGRRPRATASGERGAGGEAQAEQLSCGRAPEQQAAEEPQGKEAGQLAVPVQGSGFSPGVVGQGPVAMEEDGEEEGGQYAVGGDPAAGGVGQLSREVVGQELEEGEI